MTAKKSVFLMISLPIVGLIISVFFVLSVNFGKPINELIFFPQFIIFGILFLFVFPSIMIFLSNLYFNKTGKKSWENWFKISLEPDYDYVFTIISIIPSAFLAIEAAAFFYSNDLPNSLVTITIMSIPAIIPLYKGIMRKLFGYTALHLSTIEVPQ